MVTSCESSASKSSMIVRSKVTDEEPLGMSAGLDELTSASVSSSMVSVTEVSSVTGLAVVMVATAESVPLVSGREVGVREIVSMLEMVEPVAEMLSMARPELEPPSSPRQMAQRICTFGWPAAAGGRVM